MIAKTLRTTTGKLVIKIPDRLNEVTISQIIDLQEKPQLNDLEAISILSGISLEELKNVVRMDDLDVFQDAVLSLSHQIKFLYEGDQIPGTVTFFAGKQSVRVNVINNLSAEPAGAFMAAREIIAEEIREHLTKHGEDSRMEYFNPSLNACCQVLAQYFFCRVTGKKYNEYEAEEFTAEIKKLRVTEALPIAKHFFTCYPNLLKPKINCFHRFRQFRKEKLAYSLLKNLNTSTQ